jgi:hypothetical protein
MKTPAPMPHSRPRTTVRIALTSEMVEALERRARRNDRLAWLEAGRILREVLVRDGDLPPEPDR